MTQRLFDFPVSDNESVVIPGSRDDLKVQWHEALRARIDSSYKGPAEQISTSVNVHWP